MSIYHLERGGHADMKRIYPMMEFDFHDWERPKHLECQRALLRGAELLLLKYAQNAECGYALMLKNNMTGYALLGWLHAFYGRNGYSDVNCHYTLSNRSTALMYMPIAGAQDISPAVRSIVRSVYECMYSESALWEIVGIDRA